VVNFLSLPRNCRGFPPFHPGLASGAFACRCFATTDATRAFAWGGFVTTGATRAFAWRGFAKIRTSRDLSIKPLAGYNRSAFTFADSLRRLDLSHDVSFARLLFALTVARPTNRGSVV